MRVRYKLILIIVFVAVVPLAVSAFTALRIHQNAVERNLSEIHRKAAENAAARAGSYVGNVNDGFALLAGRTIQWSALSEAERQGALWLVYRQFADAAVVSLLDEAGVGVGASAYLEGDSAPAQLDDHPRADLDLLQAFSKRIPFAAAKKGGVAWGAPFRAPKHDAPLLPVAMTIDGPTPGKRGVIAMALSMRTLCAELAPPNATPSMVVADASGAVLCASDPQAGPKLDAPIVESGRAATTGLMRHVDGRGQEALVAVASLPQGWLIAASQPVETAFVASRQLKTQSMLWTAVALIAALGSGLVLSGGLLRPIRQLAHGARQLTEGKLDYRLNMQRGDELGELGDAFDKMSGQIAARDAEIRAWNEELKERVAQRTAELGQAQRQLLASHKMAAVSTLAAGAAHEINNPLTSVLGVIQLQRIRASKSPERAADVKLLESAEAEAKRIKSIVERMLELGQADNQVAMRPVAIEEIARSAVALLQAQIDDKHLEVRYESDHDVPPVRGSFSQLQHAMVHVIRNAITASPDGGVIEVRSTNVDGELVTISFADQGHGIAKEHLSKVFEPFFTTKDNWQGQGLGLAVAFNILQNHTGSIRAESKEGQGTTITMSLPAARKLAHLE